MDRRCRANKPVDVNHFVSLRVASSWHASPSMATVFQLNLSCIYPSVGFTVTPVNAVPIIPTALSKNLSGPLSITDVQGTAKSGYALTTGDSVCSEMKIFFIVHLINKFAIIGYFINSGRAKKSRQPCLCLLSCLGCLLSIAVACVTVRLNTCSLAWPAYRSGYAPKPVCES